ncbi:MAG: hypothetical protein IJS45_01585 [Clostridia bacterium]|nr:hypothetical protein [Clostridia bacterium]
MKNTDVEYKTLSVGANFRFYGANSGTGYVNTPDERLKEQNCDVKVLIKGGPGTGKSTFIKKFADAAKDSGYGVTRYLCSSDPHSLDAALVEREGCRIVICDATSPHVCDMEYPGARSVIFDLTEFWDRSSLARERDRIVELSEKKRMTYGMAYRSLRAANETQKVADSLSETFFSYRKAEGFCERTVSKYKSDGGEFLPGYTSSLSMSGAVRLDSFDAESSYRIFLDDHVGAAKLLLSLLLQKFRERGIGCAVSLDPLDGSVESILTSKSGILWTRCLNEKADKVINCERFVIKPDPKLKSRLKLADRCVCSLVGEALSFLSDASKYHFELEKIYSAAVDFNRSERSALERIYGILN